jgi:hypothetical protein
MLLARGIQAVPDFGNDRGVLRMSNRLAMISVALLLVVSLPLAWAQEKPGAPQNPAAASQPATPHACPMKCEGDKTYPRPGQCPKCGMDLLPVEAQGYSVELTAAGGEIKPAVATKFEARLKDAAGKPAKALESKREQGLFVVIVSDDLSWFAYEHPDFVAESPFTFTVTFPHPGKYRVYYSFVPDLAGWHPAPSDVTVAGQAPAPARLKADSDTPKEVEGYRVEAQTGLALVVGREADVTFTVARGVRRLATLQVCLGAPAQLFLVSQDLKNFIHAQPVDQPGGTSSGPEIPFTLRFPAPGLYRGWYLFQHKEQIVSVPFTFDVSDAQKKK